MPRRLADNRTLANAVALIPSIAEVYPARSEHFQGCVPHKLCLLRQNPLNSLLLAAFGLLPQFLVLKCVVENPSPECAARAYGAEVVVPGPFTALGAAE